MIGMPYHSRYLSSFTSRQIQIQMTAFSVDIPTSISSVPEKASGWPLQGRMGGDLPGDVDKLRNSPERLQLRCIL
jgi:hypothetical protein